MSRIGRMPIAVPAGVEVVLDAGNLVTVKGPLGTLRQQFHGDIKIEMENIENSKEKKITVTRPTDEKKHKALHGLTRALLNNMVLGVTNGFSKTLEINGVSYRAAKTGKAITLNLGHSHPIVFEEENGVSFDVPTPNTVIVKGTDKHAVGQVAAAIRSKRPPEPYLGKGVKYSYEKIRRKAGKTGK